MHPSFQKRISEMMNKGFVKAAKSFSQMINHPISLAHSNTVIIQSAKELSYSTDEKGDLMVLTTGMIGELRGKSILLISEDEQKEIFHAVSPHRALGAEYQQALMLEIDNIVSAAVISQIANELNIQVYGDVPMMKFISCAKIHEHLSESLTDENGDSVFLSNATFLINSQKHIHPQFIWKIGPEIFDLMEQSTTKL